MTVVEFAARAKIGKTLAYELIRSRRVRHRRIGGKIILDPEFVEEFLKQTVVEPVDPTEAEPRRASNRPGAGWKVGTDLDLAAVAFPDRVRTIPAKSRKVRDRAGSSQSEGESACPS